MTTLTESKLIHEVQLFTQFPTSALSASGYEGIISASTHGRNTPKCYYLPTKIEINLKIQAICGKKMNFLLQFLFKGLHQVFERLFAGADA